MGSSAPDTNSTFSTLWRQTLFGAAEAELLQACVLPNESAAVAWRKFNQRVDPKTYFETHNRGAKGLLPLVATRLEAMDAGASNAFKTYARVALLREELRTKIYFEVKTEVATAVNPEPDPSQVPLTWLKGAALSRLLYPADGIRHNHALEFMIAPNDLSHTAQSLLAMGLQREQKQAGPGEQVLAVFKHHSGLPVVVHGGLPLAPCSAQQADSSISPPLSGTRLLWGALHAGLFSPGTHNLRWAVDCARLIQQDRIDWQEFELLLQPLPHAQLVVEALREICALAALPQPPLANLPIRATVAAKFMCMSYLTRGMSHRRVMTTTASQPRLLLTSLRFAAWPPADYVWWRYGHATIAARLKWRAARMWRMTRHQRTGEHLVTAV